MFDPVYREHLEQPSGRRYLGTELVHFREHRDGQGETYESGLHLLYRQETRDYGEFEIDAALLDVSSASTRVTDPASGALVTLRQRNLALDNDWLMHNSVGVDRTIADPLLTNSYRFKLPSSLLVGVSSHLSSRHEDFRFGIGKLGNLETGQVQTFDSTGGRLVSLGYSRDFKDHYHGGIHLVSVYDAERVVDHESVAAVLHYEDPRTGRRLQAHALGDSEGSSGIWLDGDIRNGVWRKRLGIFRLEPDLLWSDVTMSNDQQGVYARIERRSLREHLTAGLEINTTDIEDRPAVNGLRTASAFLTGGRFVDVRTSIGGTLNFRDVSSMDGMAVDDSRETELSIYTTRRMAVGSARVQLLVADLRNGPDHGHRTGVTWDQRWNLRRDIDLSSSVGFDTERGTGNDEDRFTAGMLVNQELGSRVRWDASVNWSHSSRAVAGTDGDSINAGFSLLWRFLPEWEAIMRASINEASQTASSGLGGSDFTEREKTLLLSIRHSRATGRPFDRYGSDTGANGYGVLEGVVFYDDNRDGIRQASERPAAGVFVYLDGRYGKTTDRDGRYEFTSVSAGEHSVSIMLEDIALPWGLDDESPQRVNVGVRERTSAAFPLVRFDE